MKLRPRIPTISSVGLEVCLVSQVEKSGLSTELRVLPISPVQLFRNLYMDLSWEPLEKGRQLQWSNGLSNSNLRQSPVETWRILEDPLFMGFFSGLKHFQEGSCLVGK